MITHAKETSTFRAIHICIASLHLVLKIMGLLGGYSPDADHKNTMICGR